MPTIILTLLRQSESSASIMKFTKIYEAPLHCSMALVYLVLICLGKLALLALANPMFAWIMSNPSYSRPQNAIDAEIESVSGFYGPGAYWAWIISTTSALVSSTRNTHSPSPTKSYPLFTLYPQYSITIYGHYGVGLIFFEMHQFRLHPSSSTFLHFFT
jgi:hypothetical protein